MSRHILVTGGAGFIGSHLVERLLADGKSVVVIDDCSTGNIENLAAVLKHPKLKIFQSKVSECSGLRELVRESDSIYHLAAAVGVELILNSRVDSIKTNLRETETILELAGEFRIPFLLTSTSEVYGKSAKEAFSEEDDLLIGPPHLSRWSYACSKLMDEFLVMAYFEEKKLPVVVARLFNTVGPRQTGRYGMVLPRFIDAAVRGEPLKVFGTGQQTRCFCYVQDTVEALVRLQNCPTARGEVFNVGTSHEITIKALAELIVKTLGSASAIDFVPYDQAYATGFQDMLRRKPILEKLLQRTGFAPSTDLRQIIELTAASRK